MTDLRSEVEALLEERPELELDLRLLVELDTGNETWDFSSTQLDSGIFGEIVSRGIVERVGDEYRLANRATVEAVLEGDNVHPEETLATSLRRVTPLEAALTKHPHIDPTEAIGVSGAIVLVVLFRIISFPDVFRRGDVVLSSNDPYIYRYWVDQLAIRAGGPFDLALLSNLPGELANEEPLMTVTAWWIAEILGGGTQTVGLVLAWYPVVSAAITGLLVYAICREITGDMRVGLAAVSFLAVLPNHAFRTGLGFADHHAFDYLWLVLTGLTLVALAERDLRDTRTWALVGVLGVSVAGQVLAWEASPLLLLPVGIYVALRVLVDIRSGISPLTTGLPIVGGIALGSFLVHQVHSIIGWHMPVVAYAPLLLLGGVSGVIGVAEIVYRCSGSSKLMAGIEVAGGFGGFVLLHTTFSSYRESLDRGIAFLSNTDGIAETLGLFSGEMGVFLMPALVFGFALLLAAPYMFWLSLHEYRDPDGTWLAPLVYGWYFFILATIQVRFSGEASPFIAIFAGLGFVRLAAWVDLAKLPTVRNRSTATEDSEGSIDSVQLPGRRKALQLAGLWVGTSSLGGLITLLKHRQVSTNSDVHDAARWMHTYADRNGWEYPRNYVFSNWSQNRAYNYFVNGESESYRFAYENFDGFLVSTEGERWYEDLRDRVGFVVVDDRLRPVKPDDSLYTKLSEFWGSETSHYRAVWTNENETRKIFTLVPGAIVAGQAAPDAMTTVSADVSLKNASFTYEHQVRSTMNGWAVARVPYPGEYRVGESDLTVAETDVKRGTFSVQRSDTAHWTLDEGRGKFVIDSEGGNHGRAIDGSWTEGREGLGFEATGSNHIVIPHSDSIAGGEAFTIAAWIRADPSVDYQEERRFPRIVSKTLSDSGSETDGYEIMMEDGRVIGKIGDGASELRLSGPRIDDGEWSHLGMLRSGSRVRLFADGEEVDAGQFSNQTVNEQPLAIGANSEGYSRFVGVIDEVQYRSRAINPTALDDW